LLISRKTAPAAVKSRLYSSTTAIYPALKQNSRANNRGRSFGARNTNRKNIKIPMQKKQRNLR
jgi:hypothetical protein